MRTWLHRLVWWEIRLLYTLLAFAVVAWINPGPLWLWHPAPARLTADTIPVRSLQFAPCLPWSVTNAVLGQSPTRTYVCITYPESKFLWRHAMEDKS